MREFSERFWWGTCTIKLNEQVAQWPGQAVSLLLSSFGKKIGLFLSLPSKLAELMELEVKHLQEVIAPIVQAEAEIDSSEEE
jgi:hypothetical protein